jgi:hypothetical protein
MPEPTITYDCEGLDSPEEPQEAEPPKPPKKGKHKRWSPSTHNKQYRKKNKWALHHRRTERNLEEENGADPSSPK